MCLSVSLSLSSFYYFVRNSLVALLEALCARRSLCCSDMLASMSIALVLGLGVTACDHTDSYWQPSSKTHRLHSDVCIFRCTIAEVLDKQDQRIKKRPQLHVSFFNCRCFFPEFIGPERGGAGACTATLLSTRRAPRERQILWGSRS